MSVSSNIASASFVFSHLLELRSVYEYDRSWLLMSLILSDVCPVFLSPHTAFQLASSDLPSSLFIFYLVVLNLATELIAIF